MVTMKYRSAAVLKESQDIEHISDKFVSQHLSGASSSPAGSIGR